MINGIDYIFGLIHNHIDDQLNITYTIRFSNSSQLDILQEEIKKKISELNAFYKRLYSPFLSFRASNEDSHVQLTGDAKYQKLDLKNYEFIRLDYLKDGNESEFIFTVSHVIMDGIGVIALSHYLLNNYSIDAITSYINYPEIKANFINFLKGHSISRSRLSQLIKYFKPIKDNKEAAISLKREIKDSKSVPAAIRTTFELSVAKEKSREYSITRHMYLLLKLVETIFTYCAEQKGSNACLINNTRNLRLSDITLINEALGNYSGRRIIRFLREDDLSFKEYAEKYIGILNDKSFIPELIQEWLSLQKVARLPKRLFNWVIKRMINPSNFTATFTYMPLRPSILMPQEFLKRYHTELIDYAIFLRVVKQHVPYFMVIVNPYGNYSIILTFNEAFMDKAHAHRLLDLYRDLLMETHITRKSLEV